MRKPSPLIHKKDSDKPDRRPPKAVLVEDHLMFREWLAQMVARDSACEVCGQTDNIRDALQIILRTRPDIVIVDLTLQGSSGLELIKDMRAQGLTIPVLVLSMHAESVYAERSLRAGARGYVSKSEASTTVSQAIKQILSGQVFLSENMTESVIEKISGHRDSAKVSGFDLLSDRELEVLQLIGKGCIGREIAARLNLGQTTVETYRARIKEKLGLRNAAEVYARAAQWVHEQGL